MRTALSTVTFLLLSAFVAGCATINVEIKTVQRNGHIAMYSGMLCVSYDLKEGTYCARRGETTFIRQGRFCEFDAADTAGARAVNIKDELGAGRAIEVTLASGEVHTLALYRNLPFICIRSKIHNPTGRNVIVDKKVPVSLEIDLARPANDLRVLGCDGLTTAGDERTSYMFLAMAEPVTRSGVVAGWLTHDRASGIVSSKPNGSRVLIEGRSEYGNLLVEPEHDVMGETFAVGYFDDALAGLEEYAGAMAKRHDIELREIPSGYCTWYSKPHGGASDEEHMAELTRFCSKELTKFGFDLLQIDDKWQLSRRDFTSHNPKGPYPNGMKPTAETIRAAGMTPGIWLIPTGWDPNRPVLKDHPDWFVHKNDGSIYAVRWAGSCLDITHPQASAFLSEVVSRLTRQWGYKYLKIDGLWAGMAVKILYPTPDYRDDNLGDAVFHNPAKTNVEAYRDGLKLVRDAAGDDVYILGCNVAQNMRTLGASVGLVDAMRIGRDIQANWSKIVPCAEMGSRLYFMHNRLWHNDPDCLMLREPLTLDQARAWGSWIAISGQLNIVSEWLPGLPAERLDVLRRTVPNHGLCSRPVDLFESSMARIWHLRAGAGPQRKDIIALFNWDDKNSGTVRVDPGRLELPGAGKGTYVGFDYWANEFVPPFAGVLESELRPGSCRVLSLRPLRERPVLVSTSRHVTQGTMDVVEQRWHGERNELSGKSDLVGNDPYELRIYAPGDAVAWRVRSPQISDADRRAGVTVKTEQAGPEVRVTISSPDNRRVSWKIGFSDE
ncbi:MAG: alpha-galactosidase [Phycisphaerales bacterium]|nr:MAG: alpha-galactosidase [Phycisphaerales bacterium]